MRATWAKNATDRPLLFSYERARTTVLGCAPVSLPPFCVERMFLLASIAAQAVIDLLQVLGAEGNYATQAT